MAFFQNPPEPQDAYLEGKALRLEVRRRLPPALLTIVEPRFTTLGKATREELPRLAEAAEAHPPVHVPYGPFGLRVDEVRTHPAWDQLKAFAAKHGLVSTGYDESLGVHRRVVQAALLHLFAGSSATYSCPLAMTDAAARVLLENGPPELRDRLVPRLLATDPQYFITSGQWMTERAGGSDVGGTETIARAVEDDPGGRQFQLYGTKWFTSAVTSEMALTLARTNDSEGNLVAGSSGLTLFCVEVKPRPIGGYEGIVVLRLKDKLGTRALPTAELSLEGLAAVQVGERGKGVKTISSMLNLTRWHNAIASASGMARATALAKDYAQRRRAFGQPLYDHPLHRHTLMDMEAETAAATALCFEVASLLGLEEQGMLDEAGRQRLRGLIPITKLTCARQAVALASEALEAFGGAGYIEDTGLPRLLRDAQVLSIWEGTTNVLSLDVLRAEERGGSVSALLADLLARAEALPATVADSARDVVVTTVQRAQRRLHLDGGPDGRGRREANARRLAMTIGFTTEALLLAEASTCDNADDDAGARFTRFVAHRLQSPFAECATSMP
ncbi:MAG: acyl-CoA dehydrogenase family protein [Myxococcota bacterium]